MWLSVVLPSVSRIVHQITKSLFLLSLWFKKASRLWHPSIEELGFIFVVLLTFVCLFVLCGGMSRCVGLGVPWSMGGYECVTMAVDIRRTLVLFSHDVGSRNQPQVLRLGGGTFTTEPSLPRNTSKEQSDLKAMSSEVFMYKRPG